MKTIVSTRTSIWAGILLAGFVILEWRLVHLQVLRHEELEEKAENCRFTTRVDQAWRGEISDRFGQPLALTIPTKDIYADLTVWSNHVDLLAPLVAPMLGLPPDRLANYVRQKLAPHQGAAANGEPGILLLKRGVTLTDWTPIHDALARNAFGMATNHLASRQKTLLKALRRWTLFTQNNQQRYYPYGGILGTTLGFVGTGTDGHLLAGRWGLEACLNNLISGTNGICNSSQDAAGNELSFCRTEDASVTDGAHAILTIDLRLQQIVERALGRTMTSCHPVCASCVVIRPATGEILAMASLPSFLPQRPDLSASANWRNHVISDRYEVGSAFKVITLAAALEHHAVTLDQRFDCHQGTWVYLHSVLHDDGHHYGIMTVRECLAKSSNIGFAQIALLVGKESLYDSISRFGCNQVTGVPLPNETGGTIKSPAHWTPTSITRVAIGQEFSMSQLQLAMAYAAIANDGELMQPMLLRQLNHADGSCWWRYAPKPVRWVVHPETARLVRAAMQDVVEYGTGKAAAMADYTVAAKTGTAQKSDRHGYLPGQVYCSFVGMLPAGKPELVIAVAVDNPQGPASGGTVAAPVFREIAEQAVKLYGIAPDKIPVINRPTAPPRRPFNPGDMIAMNQ